MAVTLVGSWALQGSSANYGYSASIASPAVNVPVGALITTGCSVAVGIIPTVSDTAGNTYIVRPKYNGSAAGVNDSYVAYCLSAIANTANVVTWSASGQNIAANNGAVYSTSSGTWGYDTDVSGEAGTGYGAVLSLSINTAAAGIVAGHFFEYYAQAEQPWALTGVIAESVINGTNSGTGSPGNAYGDHVSSSAQTGFAATATDGTASLGGGNVTGFLVSYTIAAASTNTATGAASVTPSASGSATSTNTATGSASVSLLAAGTVIATVLAVGAASIAPIGIGSASATNPAAVVASVSPAAAGSATSTLTISVAASVTPSAAGSVTVAGTNPATGSASVQALASGRAQATLTATGAAFVFPQVSGALQATQTASGSGFVTPTASGTVQPPIVYVADGLFYALQPTAFFYAPAQPEQFYARQAASYFYARQNDMTTPIFSAKHPTSTRVATFDATPNLVAGETLTSITSQSVTVISGNDPAPAVVATSPAPAINSASVTVPTIGGSVTISAGCCVQCDVTGGVDGARYLISFVCPTSNPNKVLNLSAILVVSTQA